MGRPARAVGLLLVGAAVGCTRLTQPTDRGEATLRIAISAGRTSMSSPEVGLAQVKQNLTLESLAGFGDDGTPRPAVAEGWTVSEDRKRVTVHLRSTVEYQDGTPVTASDVAAVLWRALPRSMGPAFDDIESIRGSSAHDVEIRFRRPSGFRLEMLEVPVKKPGSTGIGTGPYVPVPGSRDELRANEHYYLGRPLVDRIRIESYPSFRSAWADMLRERNDMLYEVGVDALDSLQGAKNVARVFTFPKRYQYLIVLNSSRPAFQPAAVRQALNLAIDRDALIGEALNGHGRPSIGPISRPEWAIARSSLPAFSSDPTKAARLLGDRKVRFTCLVMPDYERLALVVKHQLEAVGVDIRLEEASSDQVLRRVQAHDFDAFLSDIVTGPTMYRLYRFFHSAGTANIAAINNPAIDAALDQVRHSATDDQYRDGVLRFQEATLADPPAIFLAWSEGARAVSRRFDVPGDPDRPDPIATLRLWRPANAAAAASRN